MGYSAKLSVFLYLKQNGLINSVKEASYLGFFSNHLVGVKGVLYAVDLVLNKHKVLDYLTKRI